MEEISLAPPRGMRDFYPEDMVLRNRIFDAWRAAAVASGFEHYDACVVESLALLKRKAGEEVENQVYAFQDKSGRDIALRAEMTPTLARMVAQRQGSLSFPIKWFCIAQCFRYERMTKVIRSFGPETCKGAESRGRPGRTQCNDPSIPA